jgi:hypothetical protein
MQLNICGILTKISSFNDIMSSNLNEIPVSGNVPSAEAVPDKDREKAKHLFADFR